MIENTLLSLIPIVCCFLSVFRRRLRIPFWSAAAGAAVLTAAAPAVHIYFYLAFKDWTPIFSAICLILVFALCCCVTACAPSQILFALLLLCCCADNIDLLCGILERAVYSLSQELLRRQTVLAAHLLVLALSLPVLRILTERLLRPLIETRGNMRCWPMIWIVPAFFYTVKRCMNDPEYRAPLERALHKTDFLPLVWIAGTSLSLYVLFVMLSETAKASELQEKLRAADLQLSLQKERYDMLQNNVQSVQRMEHDLRHHMYAVRGYLNNCDSQGLQRYLSQNIDLPNTDAYPPVCVNSAVDAVARHYAQAAQNSGAQVRLKLEFPAELAVAEADVCAVVGNLMENAAEACARQTQGGKFLEARGSVTGSGILAIRVRNSCGGPVRCRGGVFTSSKRAGKGIGIDSVRHIAERHQGSAEFTYRDGVFEARVVLYPR